MFYPQLVAGPIERPQNLLHQFHSEHSFDYEKATSGLKLMMWGLFKKVVIADRFAVIVNQVFNKPHDYSGAYLMVATFLFAFQIYCDFSGYSDIARGSARVMGFELMKNFDSPYLARSISEFWKRWHISLSTWFRDYLYIPLGGNRVSKPRWYLNLFLTFLVSGLWHGANWTFIIWGCLHGLYLVTGLLFESIAQNFKKTSFFNYFSKIGPMLQTLLTFILVSFAWIFFRANTLSDAIYIILHMFRGYSNIFGPPYTALEKIDLIGALPGFVGLFIMGGVELMARNNDISKRISRQTAAVRWVIYYALILITLIFGVYDTSQFIYFQF
jgi:D-alanyl-lipoteichoic acid acyltransferase DltB (MBOAT superfamily)